MRPHHQTSQKETWASIKQQSMYRGGGGGTESHAKAKVERQLLTGLQELLTKIGADRSASQVTPSQQLSKKARKRLRKQDRSLLSALSALVERATKGKNSDVPLLDRLRGLVAAAEQGLVGEWNPDGRGLAKNASTTARVSQAPQAQVSKAKGLEKGKGKANGKGASKEAGKGKGKGQPQGKGVPQYEHASNPKWKQVAGWKLSQSDWPDKVVLTCGADEFAQVIEEKVADRKFVALAHTKEEAQEIIHQCESDDKLKVLLLVPGNAESQPELVLSGAAAADTRFSCSQYPGRHNGRVATGTCWAYRLHAEAPALKFSVVVKGEAHPTVGALVKKPPGVLKDDKKATTVALRFQLGKRYVSADTWKQCLAKAGEQARLWAHSSGPHMVRVCQDTFHFSVVGNNLIQGLMRVKIGDHADELIAKSGQMHNNMRWFVEPLSWQQCKLSSERPDVKWVEIAERESAQAYAQ